MQCWLISYCSLHTDNGFCGTQKYTTNCQMVFSLAQHEDVFNHALNLWRTLDPDELLDRHQHLLKMSDGELGKCSPLRRRLWIADVESAMKAKSTQQQKAGEQNHEAREREEEPDELEG